MSVVVVVMHEKDDKARMRPGLPMKTTAAVKGPRAVLPLAGCLEYWKFLRALVTGNIPASCADWPERADQKYTPYVCPMSYVLRTMYVCALEYLPYVVDEARNPGANSQETLTLRRGRPTV
jgi:hypothetical protein